MRGQILSTLSNSPNTHDQGVVVRYAGVVHVRLGAAVITRPLLKYTRPQYAELCVRRQTLVQHTPNRESIRRMSTQRQTMSENADMHQADIRKGDHFDVGRCHVQENLLSERRQILQRLPDRDVQDGILLLGLDRSEGSQPRTQHRQHQLRRATTTTWLHSGRRQWRRCVPAGSADPETARGSSPLWEIWPLLRLRPPLTEILRQSKLQASQLSGGRGTAASSPERRLAARKLKVPMDY